MHRDRRCVNQSNGRIDVISILLYHHYSLVLPSPCCFTLIPHSLALHIYILFRLFAGWNSLSHVMQRHSPSIFIYIPPTETCNVFRTHNVVGYLLFKH